MTYILLKYAHILRGYPDWWRTHRRVGIRPALAPVARAEPSCRGGAGDRGILRRRRRTRHAIILLVSGAWPIAEFFGGWKFIKTPWLARMVILFSFEFIEGNTVTRLYFMRLRRLTCAALKDRPVHAGTRKSAGGASADLHALPRPADAVSHRRARGHQTGDVDDVYHRRLVASVLLAAVLTFYIPRLYLWGRGDDDCWAGVHFPQRSVYSGSGNNEKSNPYD